FIGAHMGGLCAPFDEMCRYLVPRPNFYLDTSNAAHTLSEREFIRLLAIHGPQHILFGTEWPWFPLGDEIKRIDRLLGLAGFGEKEKGDVFSGNLSVLLRL
ncbi:MAG: amidohydrolase family protein, partial [Deltaproteobacteria bacterium]|nr:amidohydrolase family protein [Deltaproteobacteria bacterium]